MLICIAHCLKEQEQVKRLAAWMAELGPYPNHRLLVGRDEKAAPNLFANSGFSRVEEITIIGDVWNKWVESCNNAFRQIAKHIEYGTREPWLWIEADCVPLTKRWPDPFDAEYREALAHGKVFVGDLVHVPEMMNVPDHMSGVAVYPGIMSDHAGDALLAHEIGWDVVGAAQILPQMHKSKLILQRWKHPSFESWQQVEERIFQVKPECVLFHADKAGSLIPLLREHLKGGDHGQKEKSKENGKEAGDALLTPVAPTFQPEGAVHFFDDGPVPIGGIGLYGVTCTCLEKQFPCPFHFLDNQTGSASTAISPVVGKLNVDDRASMVRDTVAVLKQLCTAPRFISQVRKELKAQGVIR